MPKQPTIRRDSVFRSTEPGRPEGPTLPPVGPKQGVPEAERSMRQTAVWLADDQLDWLDQECRKLRRAGWRSVNRSIVIRALLDACVSHEPDYGGVQSERELSDRFLDTSLAQSPRVD